jgi:hypothetical protein
MTEPIRSPNTRLTEPFIALDNRQGQGENRPGSVGQTTQGQENDDKRAEGLVTIFVTSVRERGAHTDVFR